MDSTRNKQMPMGMLSYFSYVQKKLFRAMSQITVANGTREKEDAGASRSSENELLFHY